MYGILIWFIELFCCFLFLGNFYDKRQEKKRTLLFMMITATLYYLFQLLPYKYFPFSLSNLLVVVRHLSACLYCFVVMQLFYKDAFCLKTLLLSIIYIGILAAIDFFSLITVFILPQVLFSISEQYFPILYAFAGVISKLLLFLAMQIIKRIVDRQNMNYVSRLQWLFAIIMSTCTFSVTGLAGSIDADVPNEIIPMIFMTAIALLVLTAIVFLNMFDLASKSRKLHEESLIQLQTTGQLQMYQHIMEDTEQLKKLSHDYSSQMQCIQLLCEEKKYDELKSYLKNLNGNLRHNFDRIHTGHAVVDAVLNSRYAEAVEKDILFVYQLGALQDLSLEPQDLVSLLSNLLSNAIEACEKIDGNRYIKLKLVPEDGQLVLSLRNSYNGIVRYIDGELVTTKTEHPAIHGLGMKNVRQVIEKYNGYCAIRPGETEFYIAVIIPLESVPFPHLSKEPANISA